MTADPKEDGDLDEPATLVGRTLAGGAEVLRPLGKGGMGAVYEVRLPDGTRAAAKVISREIAGRDRGALRRFLREASAATKIKDPNVVRVLDLAEDEALGAPFLLMELLRGEDLASLLSERAPLEPTAAVRIVRQAARGLAAAHAEGVVHRDIKPANLFLHEEEGGALRVKVCDFGIAKQSAEQGDLATTELTRTGGIVGSPAYMSPEQAQSAKHVDHRSDLFSLCITLYEALSGRRAWEGRTALGELLVAICTRSPASLGEVAPWVSPELAAVVERGFKHDLEARWQSAEDLYAALEPFRGDSDELRPELLTRVEGARRAEAPRGLDTVPTGTSTSVSLDAPPRRAAPVALGDSTERSLADVPSPTLARPPKRGRASWLVAGVAVLGLGGAAFLRAQPSSPGSPAPLSTNASIALASSSSTLACPPLEASGVEAPSGWLGAAAADLACRRATWLLGGRVDRTRSPAELLSLPRQPSESFPNDPFGEAEARSRAVNAAKSSSAWLDGRVAIEGATFHVTLAMRQGESATSSPGEGRGESLHAAVANALGALESAGAIPRAAAIDPEVLAWEAVPDVETALDYDTIDAERYTLAKDIEAPCAKLWSQRAKLGAFASTLMVACVPPMKWPEAHNVAADHGSPGALAISAFAMEPDEKLDTKPLLAELDAMRLQERSVDGRAMLAKAEARLHLWRLEQDAARPIAANALRESPRDIELWNDLDTASSGGLASALSLVAWAPADAHGWLQAGLRSSDADALVRLSRAHALSPSDVEIGSALGRALVKNHKLEEARALAAPYSAGPPQMRFAGELMAAQIDAAEAKFQRGLTRLRKAFAEAPSFGVSGETADGLRWQLELASLLGLEHEVADEWIERFVLASPSRLELDATSGDSAVLLPLACASASAKVARACFSKLDATDLVLARGDDWKALVAGSKAVAAGDPRAAARAWQRLLNGAYGPSLPPEVFDAAGEDLIAAKLDESRLRDASLNGVSRAFPRSARRAAKQGDRARARELAEKTVSAWVMSDAELADVRAMRELAAR